MAKEFNLPSLDKAILNFNQLNIEVNANITSMLQLAKLTSQVAKNTGRIKSFTQLNTLIAKNTELNEKLGKEVKGLTLAEKKLINAQKQLIAEQDELSKQTAFLTVKKRELAKVSTQEAKDQLNLITTYEKLAKELKDTKNAYQESHLALGKNAKQTQELRLKLDALNKQMREVNKETRQSAKEQLVLVGAYEKLSQKLIKTRKAFKESYLTLGENSKQTKRLKKELDGLNKAINKVDKLAGQSGRNVGNYGSALKGVSASLLGAFGVVAGVQLFADVLRGAFNKVREFGKESSKLQSILGASKDEVASLSAEILNLGATTVFTATEVTKGATELAKLGQTAEQIEVSLQGVLDGAVAMGSTVSESAKLSTSTLKAFGLQATETERVISTLSVSTTKSALDFAFLNDALPYASSGGKLTNAGLEKTVALLGILADNGQKASISGTSLRKIFTKLATKGLELDDALQEINESTNKSAKSQELFGLTAVNAGVILAENRNEVDLLTESITNQGVALDILVDTQLDNLDGSLRLLDSAWEGFILSVDKGTGVFGVLTRGVVDLTTSFLNLITSGVDYNNTISQEQVALNQLILKITATNIKEEDRIDLIKKLKVEYPELIKLLGSEELSNIDLLTALEDVNLAYSQKNLFIKEQQKLNDAQEKENELLSEKIILENSVTQVAIKQREELVAKGIKVPPLDLTNLQESANEINFIYKRELDTIGEIATEVAQLGLGIELWRAFGLFEDQTDVINGLDDINDEFKEQRDIVQGMTKDYAILNDAYVEYANQSKLNPIVNFFPETSVNPNNNSNDNSSNDNTKTIATERERLNTAITDEQTVLSGTLTIDKKGIDDSRKKIAGYKSELDKLNGVNKKVRQSTVKRHKAVRDLQKQRIENQRKIAQELIDLEKAILQEFILAEEKKVETTEEALKFNFELVELKKDILNQEAKLQTKFSLKQIQQRKDAGKKITANEQSLLNELTKLNIDTETTNSEIYKASAELRIQNFKFQNLSLEQLGKEYTKTAVAEDKKRLGKLNAEEVNALQSTKGLNADAIDSKVMDNIDLTEKEAEFYKELLDLRKKYDEDIESLDEKAKDRKAKDLQSQINANQSFLEAQLSQSLLANRQIERFNKEHGTNIQESEKDTFDARKDLIEQKRKDDIAIVEATIIDETEKSNAINKINSDSAKFEIDLTNDTFTHKIEVAQQFAQISQELASLVASDNKELAVALALLQVPINAVLAYQQGLKAGKGVASIPLAIAYAGLATVAGLVQVQKIRDTEVPQHYDGLDEAKSDYIAQTDERGAELHLDEEGVIKDYGVNTGARYKQILKGDKIITAQKTKDILKNSNIGSNGSVKRQKPTVRNNKSYVVLDGKLHVVIDKGNSSSVRPYGDIGNKSVNLRKWN